MPPKAKFSKAEIVQAALQIVKEQGMDACTAREVADALHSSPRPIFTIFSSMEELQAEVMQEARKLYHQYVQLGLQQELPFRGVGLQYIRFACEQPILFNLLFMKQQNSILDLDNILSMIDQDYEAILKSIEDSYQIYGEQAKRLYQHIWIYTHGIAVLSASNVCEFQQVEISALLTEVFRSVLKTIKG